jgi:hypothetical protein
MLHRDVDFHDNIIRFYGITKGNKLFNSSNYFKYKLEVK